MTKIITMTGQRGGSGKSVAAVNIAASLAVLEKKTLLIDCDPQAKTTEWSGITSTASGNDLARVFEGKTTINKAIHNTQLGYLDIIPAGFDLFPISLKLSIRPENQKVLKLLLSEVSDTYEYIIIDPPSSFNYLSMTAMTAADFLLVSVCPGMFSKKDLQLLLAAIKHIHIVHEISLTIAGFLNNRCRQDEPMDTFLTSNPMEAFKNLILRQSIPEDPTVNKALDAGLPVSLHRFKCPAASAYLFVAKEIDLVFNKRGVL